METREKVSILAAAAIAAAAMAFVIAVIVFGQPL